MRFFMSYGLLLSALILVELWSFGSSGRSPPCNCSQNHFACPSTRQGECKCIPVRWRCDSEEDCSDGSDERNCDAAACSKDMFMCTSGKCIISSWWCDGESDCEDASDESDCGPRNCTKKEFVCGNLRCIPLDWRCDSTNHCGDNTDEDCTTLSCGPEEFRCTDGGCIALSWRCDTNVDCPDSSDEEGCTENFDSTCPPNQYRCSNSRCISASYECDGDNDCGDWSDESKCEGETQCREGEFSCDDGLCINNEWKCDGEIDCDDESDERDCQDDECLAGQFRCNDGSCISQMHVCNGDFECPDGSDELGNRTCQTSSPCREDGFPCQHLCLSTSTGSRCSCKQGYHLALDRRSCIDVDECEVEGTCGQKCENTVPGYKCSCAEGYVLDSDNKRCKASDPEPYLVYANGKDIRKALLSGSDPPGTIIGGLQNTVAVDFHWASGRIFWSDLNSDSIRSALLNGTDVRDVITHGLSSPAGLAVEWTSEMILWTDSGTSRIEVANLDGSMRRVLIWKEVERPRAIVVNPEEGTLYWTDWGSRPRIEKAFLDGSGRRAIVDTSLFWPNGLTIDYPSQKVYWADAKHHVIECSFLDGSSRKRVIEHDLPHPFAITVFEEHLFWTDWRTKSIHKANKFSGHNETTLHSKLHYPMDIIIVHPLRQPSVAVHRCAEDNGGCSHLCLPNNESYSCLCTIDAPMPVDNRSCSREMENFLMFTRRSDVRWMCLGCEEDVDIVFSFSDISSAEALDWAEDAVYWTDVTSDTISRARLNGSEQQVVVENTLASPDGIAYDWATNKLYWTDSGTKRIEVANADGSMRSILIWENLSKPRDIIVDPLNGFMYWTDWGQSPKIERAGMDGSSRAVVIDRNLTWPNCLAMDHEMQKIFWTDAGTRTIESSDYNGHNRQVLISTDLPHPFGLTLFEDRIYWTDCTENTTQSCTEYAILSADKITGQDRRTILRGRDLLIDIQVYHKQRPTVNSVCRINNGGCSHLCLIAPTPKSHSCKCPTGILLRGDEKTCARGMKNFLIAAKRTDIRKVSLDVPYLADVVLPIKPLNNVIALDVDIKAERIYWTDIGEDKIQSSRLDGSDVVNVVSTGLGSVDFLAVDSVGRKLYWTDDQRKCIEVSELDDRSRKVLIWNNLDSPRAIALHYEPGLMYWTDWGNQPRIERSHMDGGKRVVVIDEDLGWPNGLTIDKTYSQLVWADARTHVIEAADLDGRNRRVLVSDVPHPYGVAVTESHIYWTDWSDRAIVRANKHTGRNLVKVCGNLPNLMDLHAIEINETGVNKCGGHNGGCSHLCLRNPLGYSCACPTGIPIQANGHTCNEAPSTFLLFANRGSIRRISMDTPENMDVHMPIPEVYNTVALDFDYAEKKIYYSDIKLDVIRRANLNGSNMETLVSNNLTNVDGLAVDWVAKNLYWTDPDRNIIEVSRADGSSRKVLVDLDLDNPRAIALHPRKGYMFWSDWGKPPKIERAFLDGNGRRVIVATDLGWPNGLTIDYEARRIYWGDAQRDRIEAADLNGKNRVQIVHDIAHPFGITQYGPYIFWTDWHTKTVERVDKDTGRNRVVIRDNIGYLMEIKMVSASRQTGSNPCGDRNGGCSHLCLFRPHGPACACPSSPDHKPCSTAPGLFLPPTTTKSITVERVVPSGEESEKPTPSSNATIRCTELDMQLGKCHIIGFPPPDPVLQTAYIALSAILGIVGVVLIVALIFWKKNASSREDRQQDAHLERKLWPWGSKSDQRYYKNEGPYLESGKEGKISNLEVAALSHKLASLEADVFEPPLPPQRVDSRQNFCSAKSSSCKSLTSASNILSDHVVCRTVETDI